MAVRAEQPEILGPVVPPVAVDVVDFERQRFSSPSAADAAFSAAFRYAGGEQSAAKTFTADARGSGWPQTKDRTARGQP